MRYDEDDCARSGATASVRASTRLRMIPPSAGVYPSQCAFASGHGSGVPVIGNGTLTVVKEKSPTSFEVEQNLQTMNGARTLALDQTTGHIYVISVERGPAPPPPAGGGRGGQGAPIPGSFKILMIGK